MRLNRLNSGWLAALLALGAVACSDADTTEAPAVGVEDDFPLDDVDVLLQDAPDPGSIEDEPKADQVKPAQFDVVEWQSPVKSQGRRGVCSVFSTVALMEHLYIKEGTMLEPDFSEQFLQWSVKFEVGAFTETGGSTATRNLEAINRFGIVDEATSPYEPGGWGTSDDERCTGEDRPTLCYTNGEPSSEVRNAKRYKLPRKRWVSARRKNIKSYIFSNKQAVTAGMTFFYQSWNHGGSKIPVSGEYKRKGYILAPNAKDKELSLVKRAGHSILIVGWDDDLEVPVLDENGKQIVDADGEILMEKGFFLIKNSWGTTAFGTENPFGAGYGWLSMKYVEEYASVVGANLPKDVVAAEICDSGEDDDGDGAVDCDDSDCALNQACATDEICDDGSDNDLDGQTDCADTDCAEAANCQPDPDALPDPINASNETRTEVPDNDLAGIVSQIDIEVEDFTVGELDLLVEITHTWRGDLTVKLVHPDGTVAVIADKEGGDADNISDIFTISAFAGKPAKGTWSLEVVDSAGGDLGTLEGWSMEIRPLQ
jgi:C1A family cysteine protease